jgi:hypothetical protein
MATPVRVPSTVWVGVEVKVVGGVITAIPEAVKLRKIDQEVQWNSDSEVTVTFNQSPFQEKAFHVLAKGSARSGSVVSDTAQVCNGCIREASTTHTHYKYSIKDHATGKVLDPEVIIRN